MLLTELRFQSKLPTTRLYVLQCVTFHIGLHKGAYVRTEGGWTNFLVRLVAKFSKQWGSAKAFLAGSSSSSNPRPHATVFSYSYACEESIFFLFVCV